METATLDVSVIICVYTEERWHDVLAAVESIQRQSIPPRELIIVVDHNPRLLKRIQKGIPDVIAIENREAQGLSGARNSGIAAASGSLIAFLDDDAVAEPDWLERLVRCCEDPQVLGAGGTVEPFWLSERPAWFPEEFYWVVGCTYQRRPEGPVVVRNPYGGCACIRREVFDGVGGLRDVIGRGRSLPMGCEETELSIRAKQRWPEKVFLYEPHAIISHRIAAPRANWRYFQSRCYAEGLSKAVVTQYVGTKDGLSSERSYVLRALPSGVLRGIADGMFRRDMTGFLRAGAIVAGLLITIAGYIVGTISQELFVGQETAAPAHTAVQDKTPEPVIEATPMDNSQYDEPVRKAV